VSIFYWLILHAGHGIINQYRAGKANAEEVVGLARDNSTETLARDIAVVENDMDLVNKEANEEAAQDYLRILI
jgi:hypothetical protein